ncbi:uncharacterized protein LOC113512948 [Galleria mellonella]|uniref:Uncharacterized protein LOC113512948 n=1 Tax=Galleria mellonella TaxID=7137 RepID=A0A6J1WFU8_GALME|nr:uncharacterized protein LOC113512948 [Galleria mellonella]
MCFKTNSFFFIKLSKGAKFFGIICTLISLVATMILLVPIVRNKTLPPLVQLFYRVICFLSIIHFFSGLFLLYGIFKKMPKFMICWILVSWCIGTFFIVIGLLGTISSVLSLDPVSEEPVLQSTVAAIFVIYGLLLIYITKAMTAFKHQLENEHKKDVNIRDIEKTLIETDKEDDDNIQPLNTDRELECKPARGA